MSKLRPALVVLTPRFFGQRISFFNHLASARSLNLDRPGAVMKILMRGIYIMLIIEAAGALLLYLHWRTSGIVPKSEALFFAIFHAVSAFATCGLSLGITGGFNGFGLLLIMFMMFWGRLGA